jgi:hypothetical protein
VAIHPGLDLTDSLEESGIGLGLGGATEEEQGHDREAVD